MRAVIRYESTSEFSEIVFSGRVAFSKRSRPYLLAVAIPWLVQSGQQIAAHRVPSRPDRHEPQAVKRPPKPFPRLKGSREDWRRKNGLAMSYTPLEVDAKGRDIARKEFPWQLVKTKSLDCGPTGLQKQTIVAQPLGLRKMVCFES
jgi:hypothetical protein